MVRRNILEADQRHSTLKHHHCKEYSQADSNSKDHRDMGQFQMGNDQHGLPGDYQVDSSSSLFAMAALQ
jgi:hypothetical protein